MKVCVCIFCCLSGPRIWLIHFCSFWEGDSRHAVFIAVWLDQDFQHSVYSEHGQNVVCLLLSHWMNWRLRTRVSLERVLSSLSRRGGDCNLAVLHYRAVTDCWHQRGHTQPIISPCGTHLHNLRHTVRTVSLIFHLCIIHFPNYQQTTFGNVLNKKIKHDELKKNFHACIHLRKLLYCLPVIKNRYFSE